jgi:hypothetical protein
MGGGAGGRLAFFGEFEIQKLDESCISNPKSEISNWTARIRTATSLGFRALSGRRFRWVNQGLRDVPFYLGTQRAYAEFGYGR